MQGKRKLFRFCTLCLLIAMLSSCALHTDPLGEQGSVSGSSITETAAPATTEEYRQYFAVTFFDQEYGNTGVYLARSSQKDGALAISAYVEPWDQYFEVSVDHPFAEFRAEIKGDTAFLYWIPTAREPFQTVGIIELHRNDPIVKTTEPELGREIAANCFFVSFLNDLQAYLFFFDERASHQMQLLFTCDGGKTWSEPSQSDVRADYLRDVPRIAKFADEKVGIVAYRYATAPDARTRTYLTKDGGVTWSLLTDLPLLEAFSASEIFDLTFDGQAYRLKLIAYTRESKRLFYELSSVDLHNWTVITKHELEYG